MATRTARRVDNALPWPAIAIASLAIVFFALPLVGLVSRAPWSAVMSTLRSSGVRQALKLSVVCSVCATALSVLLGLPLAWLLARRRFAGQSVVRALCMLSMLLPPVVGGVALMLALEPDGLVGGWLDRWFDVHLPFTAGGVVIAQTFVAMPFFVLTVEAALRRTDGGLDAAARTLGASSWYSFRRVTLPGIRSALVAGMVLSWARAFGEFGATLTFAGSFPGKTQTLPLSVYSTLDTDRHQAITVALVMVVVSFGVLVALRGRWLGGRSAVVTLRAHIVVAHGSLSLDMWLDAAAGEVVALLGPYGAGKTTILRCIAGLVAIDRGSIEVDDEILDDPSANVFVPSAQRSAGIMSDQHQLFPRMSVLENVAFGLRARGVPKAEAHQEARHWLRRVDCDEVERSRPEHLSDSQSRRVALARALACQPKLLLLDDPLGALDPETQVGIRRELRKYLGEFRGSAILVTHNPIDAYTLADRVVIVENGHVVQDGTFADIATHPRSPYVAELVGLNLLPGSMMGGVFAVDGGATLFVATIDIDGPAIAVIRPQDVSLHASKPEGNQRNTWKAAVIDVDRRAADRVRVRLQGPVQLTAEITTTVADALRIRIGLEVWAAVMTTEIAVTLN